MSAVLNRLIIQFNSSKCLSEILNVSTIDGKACPLMDIHLLMMGRYAHVMNVLFESVYMYVHYYVHVLKYVCMYVCNNLCIYLQRTAFMCACLYGMYKYLQYIGMYVYMYVCMLPSYRFV